MKIAVPSNIPTKRACGSNAGRRSKYKAIGFDAGGREERGAGLTASSTTNASARPGRRWRRTWPRRLQTRTWC